MNEFYLLLYIFYDDVLIKNECRRLQRLKGRFNPFVGDKHPVGRAGIIAPAMQLVIHINICTAVVVHNILPINVLNRDIVKAVFTLIIQGFIVTCCSPLNTSHPCTMPGYPTIFNIKTEISRFEPTDISTNGFNKIRLIVHFTDFWIPQAYNPLGIKTTIGKIL